VDDNKESLMKRFKVYQNETKPIIEYFTNLGKAIVVNAEGTPEHVFDMLETKMNILTF
jgi:adenylate kinase family enzyme